MQNDLLRQCFLSNSYLRNFYGMINSKYFLIFLFSFSVMVCHGQIESKVSKKNSQNKPFAKDSIKRSKKNNVKFVIFEDAIDERLVNSQAVMSYNEWFTELKAIKQFW